MPSDVTYNFVKKFNKIIFSLLKLLYEPFFLKNKIFRIIDTAEDQNKAHDEKT